MRKLTILFLYLIFMSSCSWFGSKTSSDPTLHDSEVEFLEAGDFISLAKDAKSLSGKAASSEDSELGDIENDELDDDELDSEGITDDELDSEEIADDELDSEGIADDELDSEGIADDELDGDDLASDLIDKTSEVQVSVSEEGLQKSNVVKNKEGEGFDNIIPEEKEKYSEGFVEEGGGAEAENNPAIGEATDFTESATPENSFSETVAPVKTYISVKKIKTIPYTKSGILVNAVYLARQGDTLKSVSNKIYSLYKKTQLLKINPHLRKYSNLPVGTKIYYNSASRPADNVNLLTYYEEQNLEPQVYTTVEGDNLRELGAKLLGGSRSWQELWATNANVESKGVLPAGLSIRYWDQLSFNRQDQQAPKDENKLLEEPGQEVAKLVVKEQKKVKEQAQIEVKEQAQIEVKEQAQIEVKEQTQIEATGQLQVEAKAIKENLNPVEKTKTKGVSQVDKAEADQVLTLEQKEEVVVQKVPEVVIPENKPVQNIKPAVSSVLASQDKDFLSVALSLLDDDMVLYSLMGFFLLLIIFFVMRKKKTTSEEPYNDQNLEALDQNTAVFLGGEKGKSSEDHSLALDATQMDASQISSMQIDATQMDVSQISSTQMDATQMDATQMDATQMDATQMDGTQMDALDLGNSDFLGDDEKKT